VGLASRAHLTLNAVARLRLDADFGIDPAEQSPSRPDRFVPGLEEAAFDMMMAYVEGAGYAGGLLGFRLGRQYVVDPLGWWSFDGGSSESRPGRISRWKLTAAPSSAAA